LSSAGRRGHPAVGSVTSGRCTTAASRRAADEARTRDPQHRGRGDVRHVQRAAERRRADADRPKARRDPPARCAGANQAADLRPRCSLRWRASSATAQECAFAEATLHLPEGAPQGLHANHSKRTTTDHPAREDAAPMIDGTASGPHKLEHADFQAFSRGISPRDDSPKVVEAPVRVRVSPSDEAPANRELSQPDRGVRLSGCAPRGRAKSQTKSQSAAMRPPPGNGTGAGPGHARPRGSIGRMAGELIVPACPAQQ
jgi:hypothetical protein